MSGKILLPSVSFSLIALLAAQSNIYAADALDSVMIEDVIEINPNTAEPDNYNRHRVTASDGGDFLSQVNGISGSRFGGRGIDPIIRGQSQTRLNILLDGSYVHGGCPNRMDPPASWAALETYEKVTVLKGVQTLTLGSGGSGGTVLFERDTRELAEEKGLHGRVNLTASDNHIKLDPNVDLVAAGDNGYIRAIGEMKETRNYEDGNGNEVRSSFKHAQAGIIAGYMPTEDRLFEISHEQNDFSDALYPGAAMDSPEEQGNLTRLRYLDKPATDAIDEIKAEVYRSDIDHVMDNYSLRAFNPMMKMQTPTTSLTTGGRLVLKSTLNQTTIEYGIDVQENERDAVLNNMSGDAIKTVSLMWPDISIQQNGIFAEAITPINSDQKLKYGVRVDWVDVSYGKADAHPDLMMGHTANQSYMHYYGATADGTTETNIGALLRYEKQLGDGVTLFTGLSRTVRTADATERGMNKWVLDTTQRWVGNPDIDPEKHNQLDIGIARATSSYSANISVFYDDVNDYILRDGARGQDGILQADNADIFRNIDAELYGIELEGKTRLSDQLDLSASLAYVRSTNTTDDRAIPQTPPLNGRVQLDYNATNWGVGSRVRFSSSQNRIDELSRQEAGTTAGYGVLDFYANATINDTFSLRFGVDNIFDKAYAEHASRSNLMDNNAIKVNEPGRTAWLKLTAEF